MLRNVLMDIYLGMRKGRGNEQGCGLSVLSVTETAGMRAVVGHPWPRMSKLWRE